VKDAEEHVHLIQSNLKAAQARQKSYADKRRRPLSFEVGDHVYIRVSPMKGVNRFGVKGKLAPRYVGPFPIIEQCGPVAYRMELPPHLKHLHSIFHISQLKKCLKVPVDIVVDENLSLQDDLTYAEHPMKILDTKIRVTRTRNIPFFKVQWSHHSEDEATWESEDFLRSSFPNFLPNSSGNLSSYSTQISGRDFL